MLQATDAPRLCPQSRSLSRCRHVTTCSRHMRSCSRSRTRPRALSNSSDRHRGRKINRGSLQHQAPSKTLLTLVHAFGLYCLLTDMSTVNLSPVAVTSRAKILTRKTDKREIIGLQDAHAKP
nr:uncharacterized protein LOC129380713 isoform X1 [Dermacentor andersoni]